MAIGDAALSAGFPLLDGSEPANTIDEEINRTRDLIAQRTSEVTPISKGGTDAKDAATARVNLGIGEAAGLRYSDVVLGNGANQLQARWEGNKIVMRVDQTDVAWLSGDTSAAAGVYEGNLSPAIYNRGTAGQWRALGVQANGVLAHTASAARFKENIAALEVTDEQVQALQLVEFDWIESGYRDVGLIADTVADAGLDPFVFHDDDGEVLGIHYDRVSLSLLPVVQRLLRRVADLEERIGA